MTISIRPFCNNVTCLFDNGFLDVAELILAEEHFVADEKRGRNQMLRG